MTKNANKFLFIIISLIVPFLSCRKETSLVEKTSKQIEEHFFQENLSNDPEEKKIIDYIKRINEKSNFVQKIYDNIGYPIWKNAVKCPQIINNSTGIKSFSTSDLKNSDTTINYIIPFVREEQSHVNAAMFIKTTSTDTTITYLCDWQYSQFKNKNLGLNINPETIAIFFMRFDNNVFNHDCFKILDTSLFSSKNKVASEVSINSISSQAFIPNLLTEVTYCVDVTIELQDWTPGNLLGVFNGDCMPCISYVTQTFCWTELVESGSNWGSFYSGGGIGSGSGNTGPYPPQSPPDYYPAWTEDIDNRTGFSKARINELKSKISQDPFELIDCKTINNLNASDGNGPIFHRIASYKVPNRVINRISYIRSLAPNWIVDNFNIESLTNAFGAVVNCDFFPVRIKKLPMGLSPKEFLEYFRKNINTFISPYVNVAFHPYKDGNFDDTRQFDKDFGNSLGSLMHINMINDGSVIISDYQNSTTPNAERHYFKFSTMATPLDFGHPVAGNREFGIYEDPNNNGEYIFYISAVDRAWDPTFNLVFKFGGAFKKGDELWENVQLNITNFINRGFGIAEFNPSKNITKRPDWEDVQDYLSGKITYQELKTKLGC